MADPFETRDGCDFAGTKYCRLLNMADCASCGVRDSEDRDRIRGDLDVYETLIPEEGISWLFETDDCQICRSEPKRNRSGFAILHMAHPEPKHTQKWLFGKKAAAYGTLIPLQFSICTTCRRRLLFLQYAELIGVLVFGFLGLFAVTRDGVHRSLHQIWPGMPLIVWAAVTLIGDLLGRFAAKQLRRRCGADSWLVITEHPAVKRMEEIGWKPVYVNPSRPFPVFSRTKRSGGLGTAVTVPKDPDLSRTTEEPQP